MSPDDGSSGIHTVSSSKSFLHLVESSDLTPDLFIGDRVF
jgi:hypothetical protein